MLGCALWCGATVHALPKLDVARLCEQAARTWGECVAAAVTLRDGAKLEYADLKRWCAQRMSAYKIPRQLRVLDALPRNAMGKVIKTDLYPA